MVSEQETTAVVRSSVLSRVRMLEQESTNGKKRHQFTDSAVRESLPRRRSPREKKVNDFASKGDRVSSQERDDEDESESNNKSHEREKLQESEQTFTAGNLVSSYKAFYGKKIAEQSRLGYAETNFTKATQNLPTQSYRYTVSTPPSHGNQQEISRNFNSRSISPFSKLGTDLRTGNQANISGRPLTFPPSPHKGAVVKNEQRSSPQLVNFDSRTPTINNSSKPNSFRSVSLPRLPQSDVHKTGIELQESNKSPAKPQLRSESQSPRLKLAASPLNSARPRKNGFEGKIQPKIPLSPKLHSANNEWRQRSPSRAFDYQSKSALRTSNVVALTWPTKKMEAFSSNKGGSTGDNSSSQEENKGPSSVAAKFSIDRSSVSSKTARVRNVRLNSPVDFHFDPNIRRNLRAASQIMREETVHGNYSSSSSSRSSLSRHELSNIASRALNLSNLNKKNAARVSMPETRSQRYQKSPIIQMLSEKREPKGAEKPICVTYGSAARLTDRLTRADRFTALKKPLPNSEQKHQEQKTHDTRQLSSHIHPVFGYKKDVQNKLHDEKKPISDSPNSPIMSPVRRSKHLSKAMRAKAEALAAKASSRRSKDSEQNPFWRPLTPAPADNQKSLRHETDYHQNAKGMNPFNRHMEPHERNHGHQTRQFSQPVPLLPNHFPRMNPNNFVSAQIRSTNQTEAMNFAAFGQKFGRLESKAYQIKALQPDQASTVSSSSEEDIEVIAVDSNEDHFNDQIQREGTTESKPLQYGSYEKHLLEIRKRYAKRNDEGPIDDYSYTGSISSEEDLQVIGSDSYEDDNSSAYTSNDETTQLREIVNQKMQAYRFQQQQRHQQQEQKLQLQHRHPQERQQQLQQQQQQQQPQPQPQPQPQQEEPQLRPSMVQKRFSPEKNSKLILRHKSQPRTEKVVVSRKDDQKASPQKNSGKLNPKQEKNQPEMPPKDQQITPDSVFLTAFESSSEHHGDSSDPNTFTGSLNKTDALGAEWINSKHGSELVSLHKPVSRLSPKIINIDENHVVQKIGIGDEDDIFEGLEDDSVIPEPGTLNNTFEQKPPAPSRIMAPPPIDTGIHEDKVNPKPPVFWTKVVEVRPTGRHSGKTIDENVATKSVASDITSSLIAGRDRILSSLYRKKQDDTIAEEDGSFDGEDDDEENSIQLEGSTDDTLQDEMKSKPAESVLINLSCAIVNSIKNACVAPDKAQLSCNLPEQLPGVSSCALNAKAKVEEKINEAWKSIDHDETFPDGDDESVTTFGQSTIAGERTLNTIDLSTVQEETTATATATATATTEGPRQVSDSGSSANSFNKKQHDQSRRKAQLLLDEHVKNAMQKYEYKQPVVDTEESVSEGPKVLDDVLSPASIGRLSAALSFEQRAVLEKFSSKLKSEGIEVLKLGRRHKWQVRFLTVSQEVVGISTNGDPSDIGQCPKALLWLKHQSSRNHSVDQIKDHGRGGVFFTNLKRVKQISSCESYTKYLPKKLKADFPAFHGVVVDYIFDKGDERQLHFCFKTNLDAQAFCTAMQIIKEVADRGTLKDFEDIGSFSTKSPSGSEGGS